MCLRHVLHIHNSKPLENCFAVPLLLVLSLICSTIPGEAPAEQTRYLTADVALMYRISVGDPPYCRKDQSPVVPHDNAEKQPLLCLKVIYSMRLSNLSAAGCSLFIQTQSQLQFTVWLRASSLQKPGSVDWDLLLQELA